MAKEHRQEILKRVSTRNKKNEGVIDKNQTEARSINGKSSFMYICLVYIDSLFIFKIVMKLLDSLFTAK